MSRRRNAEEVFPLDNEPLWYKDAIVYELHVRAFYDSNGDGIGDFPGLVQKLDFLQDLGVSALWLLPFYPSPLKDDGYDIADYTDINPIYGTLADFKHFLREAHRRGLRVITELVVNHTSDQHPWFQRARRAAAGTVERDFYVWSATPDRYKDVRVIFKDFEPSNWAWDPVARAYYWHRFYSHQPDLNYDNPAVHEAIFRVVDFWLGLGIDGLRLDAVPYLYEREGTNCENLPQTHEFLKELRRHVDGKFKSRMLLAEANQWPEDSAAYFGNGDECHMAFHFPVMPRLFMAIRMEDRFPVIDILQQTPSIPETSQWALFLRNHDELTLEMVTDEDRDYMYRVYAQDPQARINLGIRRRLAPLLGNHRAKIELMNGLLFSLPGAPVLYYGDEIGMGDNIYLGDRNGVRTPMQWNAERNAGFSRGNPQRLYLPAIIDPEYHYEALNAEAQQNNPNSLLWWMKHLIGLRKRYPAFSRGSVAFLYPENPKVLAFVRRYQDQAILVIANLSRFIQYAELDLSPYKGLVPVEMLGWTAFPTVGEQPYLLSLGPYAFYWFILEPQGLTAVVDSTAGDALPTLQAKGKWEDILEGKARSGLEKVLPGYLQRRPWFKASSRSIAGTVLVDAVPVPCPSSKAYLTLVRVDFIDGDPQTYVLPLAYVGPTQVEQVQKAVPQAIVGKLRINGTRQGTVEEGLLYEPLGERAFTRALLGACARRRRYKGGAGELRASHTPAFRQLQPHADAAAEPVFLKTDHGRNSLIYGDGWVLKVFRKVEGGVNPDLEVGCFLAEKTSFSQAPPLAGAFEYRPCQAEPMTVAILEGFVANEGNAWQYTVDALGRYFEQVLTRQVEVTDIPLPQRLLLNTIPGGIPTLARDLIGSYLETARLLGQRTGELHVALASAPDVPDFAPVSFTVLYQRSLYQSVRTQARRTMELLGQRLPSLGAAVQDDSRKLLASEEKVLGRVRLVMSRAIAAMRTRYHGDLHLGEWLYTGKDFVIIDFEGSAFRSLSDRRLKRSPLRDVASMLRSFRYAAALIGGRERGLRPEDVVNLQPWARFWHLWVCVAFLDAYLTAASKADFLPRAHEELAILLEFHLIERAVNELRYELLNHPERVWIPIESLLRLLETAE